MRKGNIMALIEKDELQKINREIVPLWGVRSCVTSGVFLVNSGRKIQCFLTIGETNTHKSSAILKAIGERVKIITGVNEVHSFGVKLA